MPPISLKAIVLASLAVFGVDIISGIILMSVFGGELFQPDMSEQQMEAAVEVLMQDSGYLTGALILGSASTVLGGYLAARLAGTLPYFNAFGFAVLGFLVSMFSTAGLPVWFRAVGLTVLFPAALFGAHLAKRQLDGRRSA